MLRFQRFFERGEKIQLRKLKISISCSICFAADFVFCAIAHSMTAKESFKVSGLDFFFRVGSESYLYAFRMLKQQINERHKKRRPQPSDFHILKTHGPRGLTRIFDELSVMRLIPEQMRCSATQ